ncbi:MAG: hypothetical protein R6V59_01655 [Dehalococcoidia bacterium]
MKIETAIQTLNKIHDTYLLGISLKDHEAIKLGIEALKRLQDNRRDPEFDHWVPLPGETQEEET